MISEGGPVQIRREVDGRLGAYTVRGVICAKAAAQVLSDNHSWLSASPLPAQMVDYRGARINLAADDIRGAACAVIGGQRTGGLMVPTALLVSPRDLAMWRSYSWLMAQAGVMRAAFTSFGQARQWAAEAGALWEAQQRHRMRGR